MLRARSVCGLNIGHVGQCRSKEAVERHRDKNTEYMRERRTDPIDRVIISESTNKSKRKRYAESQEVKLKHHGQQVARRYGITRDQYWELYAFQQGRCAICMIATGKAKRLSVDHDHKVCTGSHDPKNGCPECIRGLLCSRCNAFLGVVRDRVEAFDRGTAYLKDPPWQRLRRQAA